MDGQGNLERTWKVREKSGNLKKWPWQAVFRKFILFKRGRMYFLRDSLSPSLSSLGAILKGKNLLSWGAKSFL